MYNEVQSLIYIHIWCSPPIRKICLRVNQLIAVTNFENSELFSDEFVDL